MSIKIDESFMKRALELAEKGMGHVNPNPLVGAVIVKDGKILGEGYHQYCGGLHAERNALADCKRRGNDPSGAVIYVTLEPCCHYGRTPPCTEAIIENRLSGVVFGAYDANPLVAGKGIEILKKAGIETAGPVLEQECRKQNEIFFHFISEKEPFVIMKYAMTADGKIAAVTGDSKWVTGEESREHVHITRKRVAAIMAGIGTVLADDPLLNCRLKDDPVNPVRIICDSKLRIPLDSQIVRTSAEIPSIAVYTTEPEDEIKCELLEESGMELIKVPEDDSGRVDLKALMRELGLRNIDSVLLEGGAELNYSALKAGIVSAVQVYVAPKLIGGREAKSPVGGAGIELMRDCIKLSSPKITLLGEGDALLEYNVTENARR